MPDLPVAAIYFDLGDTLATAVLDADDRLESLTVLSGVLSRLRALHERHFRLGIISNTPPQQSQAELMAVLNASGLGQFFDTSLCIFSSAVGVAKPDPRIYRLALRRARQTATPHRCLFVGESAVERAGARAVGMEVASTPTQALQILGIAPPADRRTGTPTAIHHEEPNMATPNGLRTFSMHTTEAAAAPMAAAVRGEISHEVNALGAYNPSELSPETVARQFAERALASDATPGFTIAENVEPRTELKTISTEAVPLTDTMVVKFRQQVDEVPVYGSLITVELDKNNEVISLNSALGEPSNVDSVARIAPGRAVDVAMRDAGAGAHRPSAAPRLYFYFDPDGNRWRLVYIVEDVQSVVSKRKPEAEPVVQWDDQHGGHPTAPLNIFNYVVDAHSGQIVARQPRVFTLSREEDAVDELGVSQHIWTDVAGQQRRLLDSVHNIRTLGFGFRDVNRDRRLLPGQEVNAPTAGKFPPQAVSAHANATKVFLYYASVLRRNSYDDHGAPVVSSVDCLDSTQRDLSNPKVWFNAAWIPPARQMVYGQVAAAGGKLRSLAAALDVAAHELTHAVTERTAGLVYLNESGALNESYSDILGVIISNHPTTDVGRWNWEMGEDLNNPPRPLRDLSNPRRFGQPAHMRDYTIARDQFGRVRDNGGVHLNSGIHNKAAHNVLVAKDGTGKFVFTPNQVGAMFYIALTQHLSRTSVFADSRRGVLQAARTLFRTDPQLAGKVSAINVAFDAVGIV